MILALFASIFSANAQFNNNALNIYSIDGKDLFSVDFFLTPSEFADKEYFENGGLLSEAKYNKILYFSTNKYDPINFIFLELNKNFYLKKKELNSISDFCDYFGIMYSSNAGDEYYWDYSIDEKRFLKNEEVNDTNRKSNDIHISVKIVGRDVEIAYLYHKKK